MSNDPARDASSPVTGRDLRRQMPIAREYAYFDHAAVSPLPQPSVEAIERWLGQCAGGGNLHWPDWAAAVETTRADVASLIHGRKEEVALVGSTSEGINIVAEGYPWREGDNVVTFANEFPANQYPWLFLEKRGVETRRVPPRDGRGDLDDLLDACDDRTRVVSVSWVSFSTGWRIDLEELTERVHRRGALVMVDAIQGLGVFPIDVSEIPIDFLAADGHKWMLGPEGAGMAFIRRKHLDLLHPVHIGWNSVREATDFQKIDPVLKDDASRFEPGSKNMPGLIGFGASVAFLQRMHARDRAEEVLALTAEACESLRSLGAEIVSPRRQGHESGIVIFRLPGKDPRELRSQCRKQKVVLSCRGGGLRISPHVYNDREDVDRLCEVLRGR
jgi:selenocysteine lyase/cysteine desulfurase